MIQILLKPPPPPLLLSKNRWGGSEYLSRFLIIYTVFLFTNNVYKHYSRLIRPFSNSKWIFFFKFLNIFGSETKIQKIKSQISAFFKNHARGLQKLPKLNFSQEISKNVNLRIPKNIDFFLKIGLLLVIWPKAFTQVALKESLFFFMYFLQNQIETKTYVNLLLKTSQRRVIRQLNGNFI